MTDTERTPTTEPHPFDQLLTGGLDYSGVGEALLHLYPADSERMLRTQRTTWETMRDLRMQQLQQAAADCRVMRECDLEGKPTGQLYHFDRGGSAGHWRNCRIDGPFEVDEIVYLHQGGNYIRPMFSFEGEMGDAAFMFCSHPPTEDELDQWVKTSYLNGGG